MKKPKLSALVLVTVLFAVFTLGYFLGMNRQKSPLTICVSGDITAEPLPTEQTAVPTAQPTGPWLPVDINRATEDALASLPGIGEVLARRIIDYRRTHGNFNVPEELLNVEGIGEKTLNEILDLIVIGG